MKQKQIKYKYANVLLLDDNTLDNFINEKMLEATLLSNHIHIRTNGQDALDYVNQLVESDIETGSVLDCMFVDLNMPLMGGLEFIQHFKKIKSPKLANCRIVILTSSIVYEDRVKSEKLDSEIIFINKPLTTEFLNTL